MNNCIICSKKLRFYQTRKLIEIEKINKERELKIVHSKCLKSFALAVTDENGDKNQNEN